MSDRNKSVPDSVPEPQVARDDDLLSVIADVEKQLSALKTFRSERDDTRQKLEQREAAITARQQLLEELAQKLEQERLNLQKRLAEVESSEGELARRRAQQKRERDDLDKEHQLFEQERGKLTAELEQQTKMLMEREERLADSAAAISRQREEIEAKARSLVDQEKALRAAQGNLEKLNAELGALRETKADFERLTGEMDALRATLEKAERLTKVREDDLAAAKAQAQELIAQVASARGESQDLRNDLARSSESQSTLLQELQGREAQLQKQQAELDGAKAELKKHAAAAHKLDEQIADFKRQLIERDGKIHDLSQKLSAATGKLREVSQHITEQAEIIGQAEQLERELDERQKRIEALERELAASTSASDDQYQDRIAQMQEQISTLHGELEIARADASAVPTPTEEETQSRIAELQDRIDMLEDALRTAHTELTGAIKENKKFRAHIVEMGSRPAAGAVPADVAEAINRRRSRLRLMRSLLHEQTEKLNQASEVLRGRFQECEQILAKRDAIASGHTALNETKRKLQKAQAQAARGKASSQLFYLVTSVLMLGALSWFTAGQIAPATYVARAIISADANHAEVSLDQLNEWQQFHEALLTDPRLLEVAAERMQRRGIQSLGTPGALDEFLKSNLQHQSTGPGQLSLEIQGAGAARAQRVLDTYIAAVCSQANAGRERRADGLGTTLVEAASTGTGPIHDQRLLYTVVIFAAGLGLGFGFVTFTWKRLSNSKERFEEEHMIEANSAENSWREAAEQITHRI